MRRRRNQVLCQYCKVAHKASESPCDRQLAAYDDMMKDRSMQIKRMDLSKPRFYHPRKVSGHHDVYDIISRAQEAFASGYPFRIQDEFED